MRIATFEDIEVGVRLLHAYPHHRDAYHKLGTVRYVLARSNRWYMQWDDRTLNHTGRGTGSWSTPAYFMLLSLEEEQYWKDIAQREAHADRYL